ncbi:Peptidase family M23 [Paenibacillus tianmuensis]|uniref:Peptidase family M23 n=1 Tax=Paenibacillus tianmuensis TaxID=624147 RepID=A0A1G4R6J1_9BACL|nr:M23 family metallopeptidase [Paenibacillus tianmuensis]SCW52452.1 Peptidase family M23 [Paenibacillus tianmuensis]
MKKFWKVSSNAVLAAALVVSVALVSPAKAAVQVDAMSDVNPYEDFYWQWPTTSKDLSDPFGATGGRWHKGIDISVAKEPVYATASGKVLFSGHFRDGIEAIIIEHDDADPWNKKKLISRYLHLVKDSQKVKAGDRVDKGTEIATSGNTGGVGYHLHLDVNSIGESFPNDYQTFNPLMFWPDVKARLALSPSFSTNQHANCDHTIQDDAEHFFDQRVIDSIGQEKFDQWFNSTPQSERSMTKLKQDFNISNEKINEVMMIQK